MPRPISATDWQAIRRHFRRSFSSNLHTAVATADAEGQPSVSPIGSLLLNREDYTGFYFELYTASIPKNARANRRVCVMSVDSGKWFWLKSLFRGNFSRPPMIKLYGELGERRPANPEEIARFQRRAGWLLNLPGGKKLWGQLHFVREIRFDGFELAKLGAVGRYDQA